MTTSNQDTKPLGHTDTDDLPDIEEREEGDPVPLDFEYPDQLDPRRDEEGWHYDIDGWVND